MFCSTIIATIARPTLQRAVQSVLDQDFPAGEHEVIVINDSGEPLPSEDWQSHPSVRIVDTFRRERIFARNSGAAMARGRYLHFLDDDDWLLPGALQSFWDLAQDSHADWLYGVSQLVDREGKPLIQLHHQLKGNCFIKVMAGEWVPMQSSLIWAESFFAIGGFTSLLHATQDVDLARRIGLRGDFAGTPAVVACIEMGQEHSSTNYARGPQWSRWAREKILSEPGVFTRLRRSADDSFWVGRILRIYLTSAVWNLQKRRPLTAASRLMYAAAGFTLSGINILHFDYWRAVRGRYISPTFVHGFEAVTERQMEATT